MFSEAVDDEDPDKPSEDELTYQGISNHASQVRFHTLGLKESTDR